jgi:hypothetical protein
VHAEAYLDAAAAAAGLLADPAVAASWERPSRLDRFSVNGLAGHLARQVLVVPSLLDQRPPDETPISLLDHYHASTWTDGDLDSEVNTGVRRSGEQTAAEGAAALAARTGRVVDELRQRLPHEPATRAVRLPWAAWSLSLEDFLVTRMLEISIHSDDLAFSVDVPTPELPAHVTEPVLSLLLKLAVKRHGTTAVLRTLSRAERAPANIAAM